ncbi:MAG: histone deacetylase family protein [Meiothermus sp.]|nr:histone deacetylase family protein [Meiothermus sp.]
MLTVYSELHRLQHGQLEMMGGEFVPVFEKPARAEAVLARIREVGLGQVVAPEDFGREPILRVHSPRFVHFLQNAWDEWSKLGRSHDALPFILPVRYTNQEREPQSMDGKLGFYSLDMATPITAGTWQAATASVNVALTAAKHVKDGASAAFALCRPPGHHASQDYLGGYCFLNNVAIAAQYLRDQGAERVAVLDIDYHHGNGTQVIFYDRPDVFTISLHADPSVEFPYFLGYSDEKGVGAGEDYNLNYPMPWGTGFEVWMVALEDACVRVAAYSPDVLLVPLGVDTYRGDPISQFKLDSPDYLEIGERIAKLSLPTLFVMEGGYALEEIGVNTVNVLQGFESAV